MPPSPQSLLASVFGFSAFRPGQEAVIGRLLAGESALAVFPTGSGKSLCYQLPALLLEGLTVVVSPLIALMKDQIDFLTGRGVAAARLDSSQSSAEARATLADLRSGRLKLLYAAPERFQNERFLARLRGTRVALMVVDEAHCISEWGHNFRPDYLKLAQTARELGAERVLALTATATPGVAEDIRRAFGIAPEGYVNTGFHRPNLFTAITPTSAAERDGLLLERMNGRPRGATVVYVTHQKRAEQVAERLAAAGFPARAYHAGLESEDRSTIQDWFMGTGDPVVVATIAFGMGIDKADIRYVYHYNLPKSLENYSQEIGRAGRDGLPAICEVLACPDDAIALENFSYGDTPTRGAVRAFVGDVLERGEQFDLSLYELSDRHDVRTLVASTLLTYLELAGVIRATQPFYSVYRFQPHRPSRAILARFAGAEATLLHGLLARSQKARTWFTIDIPAAAAALREPRERLIGLLTGLEEAGDLTLQVAGLRLGYRRLGAAPDLDALTGHLADQFERAEARDIERLGRVLALAGQRGCHVRSVLAYFGEELGGDCGHCDRCRGDSIPALPPLATRDLGAQEDALLAALRAERHAALTSPRQLTRFLCGLSSPATARARPPLTRHRAFGALSEVPFRQVLDWVSARTSD